MINQSSNSINSFGLMIPNTLHDIIQKVLKANNYYQLSIDFQIIYLNNLMFTWVVGLTLSMKQNP